ncbi:hypothetical protein ON010_g4955 [Phytophthora cinnamomi]|nr:hypothetical protein ON010_g4955 [Phytophthora cinnamomi]
MRHKTRPTLSVLGVRRAAELRTGGRKRKTHRGAAGLQKAAELPRALNREVETAVPLPVRRMLAAPAPAVTVKPQQRDQTRFPLIPAPGPQGDSENPRARRPAAKARRCRGTSSLLSNRDRATPVPSETAAASAKTRDTRGCCTQPNCRPGKLAAATASGSAAARQVEAVAAPVRPDRAARRPPRPAEPRCARAAKPCVAARSEPGTHCLAVCLLGRRRIRVIGTYFRPAGGLAFARSAAAMWGQRFGVGQVPLICRQNAAAWAALGRTRPASEVERREGPRNTLHGDPWSKNDVIGCMLDLDGGTVAFTRNGVDLGVAFRNVKHTSSDQGFFPAISVEQTEILLVNIGSQPFLYEAPGFEPIISALETSGDSTALVPSSSKTTPEVDVPISSSDDKTPAASSDIKKKCEVAPLANPQTETPQAEENPAAPSHPPIDLMKFETVESLESLGLERLKMELSRRDLKCGGNLAERAARLFSVRGKKWEDIDAKIKAKKKNPPPSRR